MSLRIVPLELREANALVSRLHRHHKPIVGHRFSIGCESDGQLVGAAIVGRPVARCVGNRTVEVTRLVTDGTKNACSKLYAAAARAAQTLGYEKIQTYILDTESGVSLRAAGWQFEKTSPGGDWNARGKEQRTLWGDAGRRRDQPMGAKQRWAKILKAEACAKR